MDFRIDKEHEDFILKVREFTEKYVKPAAAEVDRKAEAPMENLKRMGAEGLMGIPFDKKYGGAGLDTKAYISCRRTFKRLCFNWGNYVSSYFTMCMAYISIWK